MELRTLRYFLAVAQARTISAAAEALHVTQPTLSRQMQELEEELGKTLFLRGKRSITLTEEGTFFRKRAQEVISLLAKTTAELRAPEALLSGDIHIGGGETDAMRLIARAARRMRQDHPQVTFHIFSGNAEDVMEKIDRDLVDFGLFIEPVDLSGYEFFRLPVKDRWGVLMRKDAPLAARPSVAPADLRGLPLLVSRQNMVNNEVAGWLGAAHDALQVVATYNLLYSASIMVEEGMGYAAGRGTPQARGHARPAPARHGRRAGQRPLPPRARRREYPAQDRDAAGRPGRQAWQDGRSGKERAIPPGTTGAVTAERGHGTTDMEDTTRRTPAAGDGTGRRPHMAMKGQARKPDYSETRPRRMAILVSSLMEPARSLVSTLYLWVSTVLGLMLRASPIWRTL